MVNNLVSGGNNLVSGGNELARGGSELVRDGYDWKHKELEIGRICGQMLDVSTDKGQLT